MHEKVERQEGKFLGAKIQDETQEQQVAKLPDGVVGARALGFNGLLRRRAPCTFARQNKNPYLTSHEQED